MISSQIREIIRKIKNRSHLLYSYPLLRIAMISPFGSLNAFFHKLRGVGIGEKVRIAHDVLIDPVAPKSITIGDYVTISPRATILAHCASKKTGKTYVKPTTIKENSWICIKATILPGVCVGKFCVVGAGAVVTEDIPDFTIVAGIPATPINIMKKRYKIPEKATLTRDVVLVEESKTSE